MRARLADVVRPDGLVHGDELGRGQVGRGEDAAVAAQAEAVEVEDVLSREDGEVRRRVQEELHRLPDVAAGVLEAAHGREGRELADRLVLDIAAGAVGDVVDEDGKPGDVRQGAEVLEDAALVRPVVVGTGNERARQGVFLERLHPGRHPAGVIAAHPRDHGQAPVHLPEDPLQGREVLVVGDRGNLARGGERDEPGNAAVGVIIDEPVEAFVVHLAVRERGDEGNPDAGVLHGVFLPNRLLNGVAS